MLEIGEVGKFIVKRKTDISYTLAPSDPNLTTYVFLHFNQATRRLNDGEEIEAFLYYDQKKRLCATMETPLITTKKSGFVEVVAINNAGVFVNIGIAKDILLSSDYLPKNKNAWPHLKDQLPCILKEKKDQLIAKIVTKEDLKMLKLPNLVENTSVWATVCKISPEGLGLYTDDLRYIFINKNLIRNSYRIGEKLEVKIIHINQANEANGSLIKQKELARLDDSQIILKRLENLGGMLPLGNASTPEEIRKFFPFSKSAFKRALGALYKERLITIEDQKITLVKK